jgi:methylase of polypeptide subunit release factors
MMQFNANGIQVHYDSWMDGGGTWFGQEYVDIIRNRYLNRQFQRCYEWCSGPGYIGFSILGAKLAHRLTLSDRYESAITNAVATTVQRNQLQDCVSAYVGSSLAVLPDHEQFDLVVANPPHYLECPGDDNYQRIAVDIDWQAHQDFFAHIGQHLTDDGIILLQENQAGSLNGAEDFRPFIEHNNLKITDCFRSTQYYDANGPTQIYYIEISK